MRAKKSKRIIEKQDAISQLVPYVCDHIRKLGEGAETRIREHVDQFYSDAGYELKPLGSDIGWAWTKDNSVTYVLKDDDQFAVCLKDKTHYVYSGLRTVAARTFSPP